MTNIERACASSFGILARRTRGVSVVIVAALLAACTSLPPAASATPSIGDRGEAEMRAALDASTSNWNNGNLKGHLLIYDESVTVMTRNGPRPTIAAIETAFGKTYFEGGKPKQMLRTEQVVVRSLSRDAALMTGRFVLSGGGLPEQSGWFSLVWVRGDAGWRVVHDHTS